MSAAAASCLVLGACSSGGGGGGAPVSTVSSASKALADAGFGTLVQALEDAGLTATVEGAAAATVLAPTDGALAATLPGGGTFDALDPATKADVLAYHVLDGSFSAADLAGAGGTGLGEVTTLDGRTVRVERLGGQLYANDVPFSGTALATTNGFAHGLDGVLLPPADDLLATLLERGYGIFATVLANAGVAGVLTDPGVEFTLLAPSDAAIVSLVGSPALAELLKPENSDQLLDVILYHALPGSVSAAQALDLGQVAGATGKNLFFAADGAGLRVNGAAVEALNIASGNGIVHGIDRLLGMETVVASLPGYALATAAEAVATAGLNTALSDFAAPATIFAPTDAAFAALPDDMLDTLFVGGTGGSLPGLMTYHTIAGKLQVDELTIGVDTPTLLGPGLIVEAFGPSTFVNDARILDEDLPASTGYVNRIDRVLTQPLDIYTTLGERGLVTLRGAIDSAGQKGFFDGSQGGQRTLLAPTEAAFEALAPGLLNCLLDPAQNGPLVSLLLGHVGSGRQTAGELLQAGQLNPTVGSNLTVTAGPDGLPLIDGVALSLINIPCTNGVIHVIDAVVTGGLDQVLADIPGTLPQLGAGVGAMVAALDASGYDDLLATEGPFTVFVPDTLVWIDAVNELGLANFDELLSPAQADTLAAILDFHIVEGQVLCADDLLGASPVTTLGGQPLAVTDGASGPLLDGDTAITVANVLASNGILHVVDKVMLPPGLLLPASAQVAEQPSVGLDAGPSLAIATEVDRVAGSAPVFAPGTGGHGRIVELRGAAGSESLGGPGAVTVAHLRAVLGASNLTPPQAPVLVLVGSYGELAGARAVATLGAAVASEPAIGSTDPTEVSLAPLFVAPIASARESSSWVALWAWPAGATEIRLDLSASGVDADSVSPVPMLFAL